MKVAKYLLTVLASTAVLAACQNDTEPEAESDEETAPVTDDGNTDTSEEEVSEEQENDVNTEADSSDETEEIEQTNNDSFNKVIDQSEDIESYEAAVNLSAAIDDEAPAELSAEVSFINGDPPSLQLSSNGEDRTISKDGHFYFYTGEEWVNATESVSIDSLFFVTYENTVRAIADIGDSLEVDKSDGARTYTYEGTNRDVYSAFEELFKVSFGTVDTSEVESKLTVEVDENDLIRSIEYSAGGEDAEGSFQLEGSTEFTTFNDVEDIELPEDAVEE